ESASHLLRRLGHFYHRLLGRSLHLDSRLPPLAQSASHSENAFGRRRNARHIWNLANRHLARGLRSPRSAAALVSRLDSRSKCCPCPHAFLVLWSSVGLFLAASHIRSLLHDAPSPDRWKVVQRFCRTRFVPLAACPQLPHWHTSPIFRSRN